MSRLTRPLELVDAQYGLNFFSFKKLVIDHGLYISLCAPKTNPSYHFFTSCLCSPRSISSSALKTSSSVNPKHVLYLSDVVVTTARLFKSENIDSFDTLVIPVITARSRYGLVLKVELKKLLMKDVNSSQ